MFGMFGCSRASTGSPQAQVYGHAALLSRQPPAFGRVGWCQSVGRVGRYLGGDVSETECMATWLHTRSQIAISRITSCCCCNFEHGCEVSNLQGAVGAQKASWLAGWRGHGCWLLCMAVSRIPS